MVYYSCGRIPGAEAGAAVPRDCRNPMKITRGTLASIRVSGEKEPTMKLTENFILRTIAGEDMLIPLGETSAALSGIVTLNGTAAVIWKALTEDCTKAHAIDAVLRTYEIDTDTARNDVDAFWDRLVALGLIVSA